VLNDVALLRLARPARLTDTVRPICLAASNINLQQYKVCVATGFGHLRFESDEPSSYLQQGKMEPLSTSQCYSAYSALNSGRSWAAAMADFNYFLCAGSYPGTNGVNICQGDSGGPLACMNQQNVWSVVGVSSFVFGCELSVFSRVSAYSSWIETTMQS